MNKEEIIKYLNQIKPYINLKAVCDSYNKHNITNSIDYNNLRVVLNGQSATRLSEEKLKAFVAFLFNELYINIFEVNNNFINGTKENIEKEIISNSKLLARNIMEALKNDF